MAGNRRTMVSLVVVELEGGQGMTPVYTYELYDGTVGGIYAANVFEAEDEVFAEHGEHPTEMRETE